jgi:hypothetical protein
MQRVAGLRQQLLASDEVEAVVRVPAVGSAASRAHDSLGPQAPEVVGDEALAPAEQRAELVYVPVAVGQLGHQAPADGMSGEAEKARRSAHASRQYIKLV